MSKNTKIILLIVAGVLLLCMCAGGVTLLVLRQAGSAISNSVVTDPTEIREKAQGIADYELPAGYTEHAVSFLGFDMVFMEADRKPMYMLMQFPPNAKMDQEQMAEQMQYAIGKQFNRTARSFKVVEQLPVTILGQETTLTISEGINESGGKVRQAVAFFEGKGGAALFAVYADGSAWDQDALDAFIATIR